jgi:hypothetical protein
MDARWLAQPRNADRPAFRGNPSSVQKRSCEADGMAQREMGFAHPFAVEFKRLAYDAVKRKS